MAKFATKSIFSFSAFVFALLLGLDNPPPSCPTGMVRIAQGNFCIDQYEWPNKQGEHPDFAMTAFQAEQYCQSVGKRLCTHTEWINACAGPKHYAYGYGPTRKAENCNDWTNTPYIPVDWSRMSDPIVWKEYARTLYKGVPSGSKPACFTNESGRQVYDMIGNVREWVKDPYGNGGYAFESSYWYGTMQGPKGCGFVVRNHSPRFASYEVGTRCCKSSD